MRKTLRLKPLANIYDLSQAAFNANPLTAQWPSMNVMVSSNRIERRWDHEVYRTFDDPDSIQAITVFRTNTGTQYLLALTETDLCKIETGSGETYSYLTQSYTTGHISNVASAVVTGDSASFLTSGVEGGDKFVLDEDLTVKGEPDANWYTVDYVDTDDRIILTATYLPEEVGPYVPVKDYRIRKVYSVPVGERWQYASVAGKFCFVNGNVRGQYWDGALTYATDINATYCNQARYCVSYANRLVIADMYDADAAARNPWLVRWSKEGDPTNWTDDTAGFNEFIDTEEPITGVGVSGTNLIVFKKNAYYIGYRTGEATAPITFPSNKRGIGLYAPYSLVHVAGTVAWMGLNDFYFLNGDTAESIGDPIRKKFFDLVSDDELEKVFGINNSRYNEILWVAQTSVGQYVFSYNWKEKSWSTYQFDSALTGLGGFGV